MKSYLLEAVAKHLETNDSGHRPSNEDRDYLRQLFVQHAFLLNAIESSQECDALVSKTIDVFMNEQRAELKPKPEEKSSIIIPFNGA
jgi:hypothetical protein